MYNILERRNENEYHFTILEELYFSQVNLLLYSLFDTMKWNIFRYSKLATLDFYSILLYKYVRTNRIKYDVYNFRANMKYICQGPCREKFIKYQKENGSSFEWNVLMI